MRRSPTRPRKRKAGTHLRIVEIAGWCALILLPILGLPAGAYLFLRGRRIVGTVLIISALVIQRHFAGVLPLLLTWL